MSICKQFDSTLNSKQEINRKRNGVIKRGVGQNFKVAHSGHFGLIPDPLLSI